jgi:hypothetical protein
MRPLLPLVCLARGLGWTSADDNRVGIRRLAHIARTGPPLLCMACGFIARGLDLTPADDIRFPRAFGPVLAVPVCRSCAWLAAWAGRPPTIIVSVGRLAHSARTGPPLLCMACGFIARGLDLTPADDIRIPRAFGPLLAVLVAVAARPA